MTIRLVLSFMLAIWAGATLAVDAEQGAQGTTTEMEQEAATPAATALVEQSGFSRGSVVRSAFTTAVENHEPVDNLQTLSTDENRVLYYTELRDMEGQTAVHRWEYNGEVMAEVSFNVRGPRWRVWSSKTFVPGWTGDWKVSVLNGAGEVIAEDMLSYTAAADPAIQAPAADAPTVPAGVSAE
ncbi:MAG: DUF2914 domain-containing protein [Gammaproteobacteria bacterium]